MFKFLKRWRGEKAAAPETRVVVEEAPQQVVEVVPEAVEIAQQEPVVEVIAEPIAVKIPEPEIKKPEPEVPKEEPVEVKLSEVELPARSLGSGIRSLFGSAVDIEDLEDILIRADFGVDGQPNRCQLRCPTSASPEGLANRSLDSSRQCFESLLWRFALRDFGRRG
jgi:hypothetical protein